MFAGQFVSVTTSQQACVKLAGRGCNCGPVREHEVQAVSLCERAYVMASNKPKQGSCEELPCTLLAISQGFVKM